MYKTALLLVVAVAGFNLMCDQHDPKIEAPIEISTQIEGKQFLLNAKDFDLQQVIALIRNSKMKDAAELEKKINDGSGINNVDLDHDSKIDYVKIKESRKDQGVALEFLAVPSSTQKIDDAVTVASVDFSRSANSGDVKVQAGYANHVEGHESSFFSSMIPSAGSIGQAMFLAWLFTPSRPYFYQPMMPAYAGYPVMGQNDLSRNRERYSQNNNSTVKQTTKPSSFDAGSTKPKRSFSSVRSASQGGPKGFDTRSVQNPPPRTSSFQRPPRPPMRGFRRR